MNSLYYRGADGAFLVFDVTAPAGLESVNEWRQELIHHAESERVTMAIVANKIDLKDSEAISLDESEKFADSIGALHFATSAATGEGVSAAFENCTREMIRRARESNSSKNEKRSFAAMQENSLNFFTDSATAGNFAAKNGKIENQKNSANCCGG